MRHLSLIPGAVLVVAMVFAGCGGGETTNTTTNIMPIQVTIQTQDLPDATVGQAYTVQLVASGGSGSYNWMIDTGGTNDGWLAVDDQGMLSGSPTTTNAGQTILVVRVTEEGNDNNFDVEVFYVWVDEVATGFGISTLTLPNAWTGQYYYTYLEAYGGSGNYVWRKLAGGVNDSWITVSTGGSVYNTPPSNAQGPTTLLVKVTDVENPALFATGTFNFNVYGGSLYIANDDPLPNAAAGQTYIVQLRSVGGSGSLIWSKEAGGVNDAWLSIDSTGLLMGTAPAVLGSVTVNVSLMDSQNPNLFYQAAYHFQIKLIAISTERLPNAYVGQNYSAALTAAGGTGSPTFSIEPGGSNYSWLQINGSNIQSITAPTSNELGGVEVIVKVGDGTNTDARIFRFEVYSALQLSTSLSDGYVNAAYSENAIVTGGSGDFVFSIETGGSNNTWLSIDTATGRIYGMPTIANLGAVQVIVRVEEAENSAVFDQRTLAFNILGIEITTTSLPDASMGVAYSASLDFIGGSGYTAWSITSGPAWLAIDPNNGALSGTPTAAAITSVTVYLYDPLEPNLNDTVVLPLMVVNTLLNENFEAGSAGWSLYSYWYRQIRDPNGSYREYSGPRAAHSGTYLVQTGSSSFPYTNCAWNVGYYMISPSIAVPATGNCYLTFWVWYEFEEGYMGTNDGGQIQYDLNGNNVWTPVAPSTPAGYPGVAGGQPAFVGQGMSYYNDGWSKVIVDLSPMAGNTVRIRWDLYTDGDSAVYRCWTIDDVSVFDLGTGANPPLSAVEPIPGDGWIYGVAQASDLTNGVSLSWRGGLGTTSFDVYLGTSSTAVAAANTSSTEFQGNQAGDTFSATNLTAGSTYYWRIDCVNSNGVTAGPIWSFTPVNPVTILIGEVNCSYSTYGRIVELLNPSPSVHQNLGGWMINSYGNYTTGYPYLTNAVLSAKTILLPDSARSFCDWTVYYHPAEPYRCWNFIHTPVYYNTYYGYTQFEAWLQRPGGAGADYFGVNVSASNRPSDLNWNGTLSNGSSYYSLWVRNNSTDTDNSTDWRGPYYHYYYGNSYGYGIYPSMKDSGQ